MEKPAKVPPVFIVRPVFDSALATAEALLAGLAGAVVGMAALGTLIFILLNMLGLGRFAAMGTIYSTVFVLGLALSPAVYFEVKKAAIKRTVYHFYADRMEYQDFKFLLQRRRGRVRLRDINDIFERAAPLQSRRGLTSVYIVIPSFPSQMMAGQRGIRIADVPERAAVRERIIDLIENGPPPQPEAPPVPPEQPPMA